MTSEEAAIITAYTGNLIGELSNFRGYIEKKLGHPVFAHEVFRATFWAKAKKASEQDFLKIMEEIKYE